jgi:hypothetical protein
MQTALDSGSAPWTETGSLHALTTPAGNGTVKALRTNEIRQ